MRAAVHEFGPVARAAVRLAGGVMVLLPLVAGRGELAIVAPLGALARSSG
jgi:hypothetical protein